MCWNGYGKIRNESIDWNECETRETEMKDKNHDTSNCISLMKRIKDVPVIEEKREKSGGGRGVWKVDV